MPSEEFPEGGPAAIRNLDTDPFLRIQEEEAETWQQTVRPEDIEGLTAVDKKRQEHIYEVILTESNHCQVLKVIQKVMHVYYRDFQGPKEITRVKGNINFSYFSDIC